ncbi:MAG: cytochrome c oxidase assembly protein [Solirubrobacteraceae bacterium]
MIAAPSLASVELTSHLGEALPPFLVALVCAWGYRRRARRLAAQGRPVARWRIACFAAGLVMAVVAVSPPLDELSEQLLLAHMVQHLLLADVGALLLVLGLSGPMLAPLLSLPVLGRLRALAHPLVALPLWAVDLYLWHLPALYQAALRHSTVHALEHAMFLAFGVNMWMALLGPLPKPDWFGNLGRLGYIIGVRMAGAVLANVLLWSATVFYPYYHAGAAGWGITALDDQAAAGGIMMVEGSFLTLGLFAWLFLRSARESQERQELLELAAARRVPLDERRAARAVAAGRGAELRARLEGHGAT